MGAAVGLGKKENDLVLFPPFCAVNGSQNERRGGRFFFSAGCLWLSLTFVD